MRGLKAMIAAIVGAAATAGPALADGPGSRPRLDLLPRAAAPAAPAAQPRAAAAAPAATTAAAPQAASQAAVATAPPISRASGQQLPGGLEATLPASFTFYPAPEAQAYLSRIGAAPPTGQVAGMIAPAGRAPADADFWAAVVTYENVGYVPETGTAAIAAPAFISEVRAARGPNAPRVEDFAVPPTYVAASDSLIWAERVAPAAGQTRTVTLSQRLLGAEGVAKLDAHLRPDQLAEAQKLAGPMMAALTFADGKQHADFKTGGREARYDVPGLITGRMRASDGAASGLASVSAADGGSDGAGGLPGWAPWVAIGVAVSGAVAWLAFLMRRSRDTIDPNLTPS